MSDKLDKNTPQTDDKGPQGTRVFRRESIDRHFAALRDASENTTGNPTGAVFVGIQGTFKGKKFEVPGGRSTLGRDGQNDIVIDDDSISLVHARLIEKNGQYRVLNLLSTNGTWVNNRKVSDSELHDGDTVCFGEAEFLFQQAPLRRPGFLETVRRWFGG